MKRLTLAYKVSSILTQSDSTQSAEAVANFFIDQAKNKGCRDLTPMKLQKLPYFAQGWHLALTDRVLFNEPIQAWSFGPVIYPLYREFRDFGDHRVTRHARDLKRVDHELQEFDYELDEPSDWLLRFLRRIWSVYGSYTPIELSNMTHEPGTPWHQVNQKYHPRPIPRGITIPTDVIRDYFKGMVKEQRIT